jgi:hypothetical protein
MVEIDRLIDRIQRQIVDAFPGTNVHTPFAEDALGLVDVQKLLRAELVFEIVAFNECELVVVPNGRRLVDHAPGHQSPPLIRGRP